MDEYPADQQEYPSAQEKDEFQQEFPQDFQENQKEYYQEYPYYQENEFQEYYPNEPEKKECYCGNTLKSTRPPFTCINCQIKFHQRIRYLI